MINMAMKNNWIIIEQRLEPDPVDIVVDRLQEDNQDITFGKRDNTEFWKKQYRESQPPPPPSSPPSSS
jgi:hypothetical protein